MEKQIVQKPDNEFQTLEGEAADRLLTDAKALQQKHGLDTWGEALQVMVLARNLHNAAFQGGQIVPLSEHLR